MSNYNGYIYLVTNIINGKRYIGRHKRSLIYSPLEDGYLGSGGLHYKNARAKYGDENFVKEILDEGPYTLEEAIEREKYWIAHYNAVEDPMFYNECYDSNPPVLAGEKAPMRNPETVKKISDALKGRKFSEEHRRHLSESKRGTWSGDKNPKHITPPLGELNSFYGKHHSDETKEKIRRSREFYREENHPLYGKHHSEETKRKISESLSGRKLSDETKEKLKIASKSKRFHRVCDRCGEAFLGRGSRTKYCDTCKSLLQKKNVTY